MTAKKRTFGEKMFAFLKEGKPSQGNKFYKKVEDVINDKIESINKEIKILNEKISEKIEIYEDEIFRVNQGKIKSVSNRIAYAKEYVEYLCNFKIQNISDIKEELQIKKEQLSIITQLKKDLINLEPNIKEEN